MKPIFAATIAFFVTLTPGKVAQSEETLLSLGTLRCTLSPGSAAQEMEPRNVACIYKPISGVSARYDGILKKLGDPAPTADKLVLLWSVYARSSPISAGDLEGTYRGTGDNSVDLGDGPSGTLSGGTGGLIELRPLVRLPEVGEEVPPLILELDLTSIKV